MIWDTKIYKLACLYVGLTELYDKTLTDLRSKYDDTEAFVPIQLKGVSNLYAKKLMNHICKGYLCTSSEILQEIHRHDNYSAQHWINEFYRLWQDSIGDAI